MKRIVIVVGTRPNFIKVTQFKRVAEAYKNLEIKIIHTGQHFDSKMADVFFEQFNLTPDFFLNIKPGSPNSQMAEIMLGLEKTFETYLPDLLVVVGDVNSTLAAAITANKLNIKLAHLESGLRSFDHTMPEEINRIITDEISNFFFITEQHGWDCLINENKKQENMFFVGNTMIDTMVAFYEKINSNSILSQLNLVKNEFVLMTIHRPATVDNKDELKKLISLINDISVKYKVVFPIHPRTVNNLKKFDLYSFIENNINLITTEPLDYFAFQKLILDCKFILTDSGGIQEESTFRQKPCLTLRPNTERPSTVVEGTNTLLSFELTSIKNEISSIESGTYKKGNIPKYWDGKATDRIVEIISKMV